MVAIFMIGPFRHLKQFRGSQYHSEFQILKGINIKKPSRNYLSKRMIKFFIFVS